eukprot:scaffold444034_cov32-Prasinocladus_malaysianus.AAC.1
MEQIIVVLHAKKRSGRAIKPQDLPRYSISGILIRIPFQWALRTAEWHAGREAAGIARRMSGPPGNTPIYMACFRHFIQVFIGGDP